MRRGQVWEWTPDGDHHLGGRLALANVRIPRLDEGHGAGRLCGRHVRVRNASWLCVWGPDGDAFRPEPVGDAEPDERGDFVYKPAAGGPRVDRVWVPKRQRRAHYIEASRFGEVNSYYHLDRIAAFIDGLLHELGAPSLPQVVAVVNAHHAAFETDYVRDGIQRSGGWLPFQGGHYRLPSRTYDIAEHESITPDGEIHLGPGWRILEHGALVEATGAPYRANASHNAGILYHEYGHHVTRHTADFRANALCPPDDQNNRKTAVDEGTCDYWTAVMLQTPHIWAWHRRHDGEEIHPRSLASPLTMTDFDPNPRADAHANGTIWAAALWDLRTTLAAAEAGGSHTADLLVLEALRRIGRWTGPELHASVAGVRRARKSFATGLSALLQADRELFAECHRQPIMKVFARHGIAPDPLWPADGPGASLLRASTVSQAQPAALDKLRERVQAGDIPEAADILTPRDLEERLESWGAAHTLLVGGDVMLGGRSKLRIQTNGFDDLLAGVLPLLRRAPIVLANLEGPLAKKAQRESRNFSYKVSPKSAFALARAGINVVTVANNHLTDCGREGILETFAALEAAGVAPLGGGVNRAAAHAPVIRQTGNLTIGLLGYYWNRRCAATDSLPGGAMDTLPALERDIRRLRERADRVVVAVHWGIPYDREPLPEDREKARFMVDCGADAVIGCHPHVIQPFEVYRDRPIFYSVGNFAFGSGNSKGEGLLVGLTFEPGSTEITVYPLYVKNRDPRVDYQPRALAGEGAERVLRRLVALSGPSGMWLEIDEGRALSRLPYAALDERTAPLVA